MYNFRRVIVRSSCTTNYNDEPQHFFYVMLDPSAIYSRHLMHEAQQAFYYGLRWNIALRSVISQPADVLGLGHRVGYVGIGGIFSRIFLKI